MFSFRPPPDVIGYPIYSGFDIDRLFHFYIAALFLIPLSIFLVARKKKDIFARPNINTIRDFPLLFAGIFPLLLFILHAKVPGTLSSINLFHDGESLVPALLTEKGFFPWRDFIVARGWIQDVGLALLGFRLFENSYWGFVAGVQAIWYPATLVAFYFLHRYLFAFDWRYLLIASALSFLIPHFFYFPYPRFILLPFVLLSFGALLRNGTHNRAALFTLFLVAQTALNPESSFLIPSVATALLLRDLLARDFRRTLTTAVYLVFWMAMWFAYLQTKGAVEGFLHYYVHYNRGHAYGSGIPISPDKNPWFYIAVALPFLLHGFMTLYWIPIHRKTRRAEVVDWVVFALHLFNLLYFRKFLSRADTHVWQVHALNLPVLLWAMYRISRPGKWLTYVAVAACCVFVFRATFIKTNLFPHRLQKSSVARMGSFADSPEMIATIKGLDRVLTEILGPSDPLFDFSNEPALFYYLLDRRPSTSYYEVSLAVREKTQGYIIDQLKADPPKVVVYHGALGANVWNDPIPNSVRHWKLSRYLLENYSPFASTNGHLLLLRNDLQNKPVDRELYFSTPTCDWGLIPHFWGGKLSQETARPVAFTSERERTFWKTELTGEFASTRYLELEFSETTDDTFFLSDKPEAEKNLERVIFFVSRPATHTTYRIPVSACPQWWGYRTKKLYLYSKSRQSLVAVRVYESVPES